MAAARAEESVRVVVQARPLLPGEVSPVLQLADGRCVRLRKGAGTSGVDCGQTGAANAAFDEFGPYTEARDAGGDAGVKEMYEMHLKDFVTGVFEGINASWLAYGQSASGKSWTAEKVGKLVYQDVWRIVQARSGDRNITVRVGVVEIYQESIRDLIDAGERGRKGGAVRVSVRTRRNGTVFLDGAKEIVVRNAFEMERVVAKANRVRQTAATGMNAVSSRSHSIITISVQQEPFEGGKPAAAAAGASTSLGFLSAKLHLVDLAGSERTKRATANGGARFAEGVSINTGLLSLAKVISALSDRASHIPYRESNLTRLLQDSLGGNSRSLVVACISPTELSREETASTLRYAMRIKNIKNKPRVNVDPASVEISDLRAALARAKAEVQRLKKENDALRRGGRLSVGRSSPRASPVSSPKMGGGPVGGAAEPVPVLQLWSGGPDVALGVGASPPRRKLGEAAEERHRAAVFGKSPLVGSHAGPAAPPLGLRDVTSSTGIEGNVHRVDSQTANDEGRSAAVAATAVSPPPFERLDPPPSPLQLRPVPRSSPDAMIDAASVASAPVSKNEMESGGSDAKAPPGSLMGRLVELEHMLQAPSRGRTSDGIRSITPDVSPIMNGRRGSLAFDLEAGEETEAARRGSPSSVEDAGGDLRVKQLESRIRSSFEQKVSKLNRAKSAAEHSARELREKLSNIEDGFAAESASRETDHQSCIAELRSLLAESQKREGALKMKARSATEHAEKQRLLKRVKSAERIAADANSKLADNAGKSDLSKANLLRENRGLLKQESVMRVRVRRLEALRARQAEQIKDLNEKERLAEIARHQERSRGNGSAGPKAARKTSAASITPRQKQMFLERELSAMSATSSRSRSENFDEEPPAPDDGARGSTARHWGWLRSMDDAKVVIKMCLLQLADARASEAEATDALRATPGPEAHLERVAQQEDCESGQVEFPKKVGRPLAKEPLSQRSNAGYLAPQNAVTPPVQ